MKIAIIGNGIAGVTLARTIRKQSDDEITIYSSESQYFFSRTALMYVYMGHMQFEHTQPYEDFFWEKNNINLVFDKVEKVDFEQQTFTLASKKVEGYDKLILATGSKPNFFPWKGVDLEGVQGLYSKQDLELMEKNTKTIQKAVVVGGGLIGIEMTEMLLSRGVEVHFLIREKLFWASVLPKEESLLLMQHFQKHQGLIMHYEEELEEIVGENGKVAKILTKKGTKIEAQFVGITVGVSPNIDFLKNTNLKINRGVLVNDFLETSIPNCYAIGDCAELIEAQEGRKNLEQVWYTGRIMGETLGNTITGNPTKYRPGNWFNSAKFFDIEYQTYGNVPAKLTDNLSEFVWQHPTKELLLHFVFEKVNKKFVGINTFGIRLRHAIFDTWLNEKKSIEFVLENLASANFDPEFYKHFELEILSKYNKQFNSNLQLKAKVWWKKLLTNA